METILYNGKFYTGDKSYGTCSAIAVKNGVIVAMGEDREILELATEKTEKIDLEGKSVLPGFIDSHVHLIMGSLEFSQIDLSAAKSFDDVKKACSQKLDWAKERGKWVLGTGFNQDYWDVKERPSRKDLDQISTEVPISIRRTCHHVSICNTKAMEVMNLMDVTPETAALNMGFYPDGTPDGSINEDSQNVIMDVMPLPTLEEVKELILLGCNEAAKQGIVEMHSDDFLLIPGDNGKTVMQAYRELAEEGKLPIRINQQCMFWHLGELEAFLADGHRTGERHGFYRIGPVKIVNDGSLGAHTAYMRKPYLNDPSTCGKANHTEEALYQLCKAAHDAGMQIATHCIGDGALQMVLEAYKKVQAENPRVDCRHGVVHCQIMDEEQQDEFKKQNLLAYIQPIFLRSDMHIVDGCVGEALAKQSYNWRRYEDMGVHQSGGSDFPVEKFDILPNLQYAVTRRDIDSGKTWYPENAITLEEAVKAFTYEGAYAAFAEQERGTLSVGKYADLVVLDKDIFAVPAEEIHKTGVELTMVEGKIAYKR